MDKNGKFCKIDRSIELKYVLYIVFQYNLRLLDTIYVSFAALPILLLLASRKLAI